MKGLDIMLPTNGLMCFAVCMCRATSSSGSTSSKNLNKTSNAIAEGKPKEAASRIAD
jgi:hypothetical protein